MKYRLFSSLPCSKGKTVAEIDTDALRFNYRLLVSHLSSSCRPLAVVKADAYGHGLPICIPALLEEGCDFFVVATLEEAVAAREICDAKNARADILILGYTALESVALLSKYGLIQTVLNETYGTALADAAERLGVRLRVHVAVDTGMHRVGFGACDRETVAQSCHAIARLCQNASLSVEGMFSHYARADEDVPDAERFTEKQTARFRDLTEALRQAGHPIPFLHICNSAGSLKKADAHMNGARLGIALYGIPIDDGMGLPLRPVMRLRTSVVHVAPLPVGEPLGYGGTFVAETPRKIATLPVGYADGWLRDYRGICVTLLTSTGRFSCPIVGRVCMDQCMIDVTDTDAEMGDTVILFGEDGGSASAIAAHAGTIPYEVLTSVSSRVLREERTDADARQSALF